MKKKIVLALLLIAMVCALFTVTSLAADHDHTSHDGWTPLDQSALEATLSGGNYVLTAGKYYLTEDVTNSALAEWSSIKVETGNTVSLCLNGHCIDAKGATTKKIRCILNYGTLNLMDCTNATVKGYVTSDGLWHKLADGATIPSGATAVDFTGGVLCGGRTQYGGAINNPGTVNMYSGNIAGNYADCGSTSGGALYMSATGTANIYGGTIAYNLANGTGTNIGAGVYSGGTTHMYGGTIRDNKATTYGGGIYVSGGTATIAGGTVENNTSTSYGGGVYVNAGTFTISGGTISGNKGKDCGGLYVKSGATCNMTGGLITGNAGTTSTYGSGVEVIGTFTMTGGEIKANVGTPTFAIYGGRVDISGGTVHSDFAVANNGGLAISGGTFKNTAGTAAYDVTKYLRAGCQQAAADGAVTMKAGYGVIPFANGKNLKLLGRAQATNKGIVTHFPGDGVEFTVYCKGDLTVSVLPEFSGRYRAEIDGELVDFSNLAVYPQLLLAKDIAEGEHTIRIVQENDINKNGYANTLVDVRMICDVATVKPTAEKELYIEFIGDSITAGMGTLGDNDTAWAEPTHSGTHAYSYMTAKKMNADYAIIAKGGIGAYMVSGSGNGDRLVDELYSSVNHFRDPATPAVHGKADIVVIGIGTNDKETTPDTQFETKFRAFVKQVRAGNPHADIVLIYNMMSAKHEAFYPKLVEELGGAAKGYYSLKLERLVNGVRSGSATNTPHPSAADNDKNSDTLVAFLKTLTKRSYHSHEGWTALNATTSVVTSLTTGKYYLTGDVAFTSAAYFNVASGQTVTLCLNGHTINSSASSKRPFANAGTLTICDCTHEVTHGYIDATTKLWKPDPTNTKYGTAEELDLYGGVVTGGNLAYGGAVYNTGTLYLENVNFAGNKTNFNTSTSPGGGGAIYSFGKEFSASNTNFIGNAATDVNGGAIFATRVTVDGGLFYGNRAATADGGAIYATTSSINNSTFSGNVAKNGGAIRVVKGGTATLADTTVTSNTATENYGGGIYASGTLTVNSGNIYGNTAKVGAGICSVDTFVMNGGKVAANKATGTGGGGICFSGTSFTMNGGEVFNNTSSYNGGGIYIGGGPFTMNGGTVSGNKSSTTGGGGIYFTGTTLTLNGGTISSNVAGGYATTNDTTKGYGSGGGIYMSKGTFNMTGGTITGNYASANAYNKGGAGIYAAGGTTNISGGTISSNIAGASSGTSTQTNARGGGIFIATGAAVNLSGTALISSNLGGFGGGGIYVYYGGKLTMSGGEISGNKANVNSSASTASGGGGIMLFAETATDVPSFTMTGGLIKDNGAYNGSAIYVHRATVKAGTARVSPKLDISGGTVNGAIRVGGAKDVAEANLVAANLAITGGFFTQNVTAFLDTAKYVWDSSNTEVYAIGRIVAQVYNGATLEQEYTDFKTAVLATVGTGKTVKLVVDIYAPNITGYIFEAAGHVVLDLNGHSINAPNSTGFRISADTGTTKIWSSAAQKGKLTVKSHGLYAERGGIQLENLQIICPGSQAVSYMDVSGKYGANYIKDCVIFTSNWHSLSFNRATDMRNEVITISGTDFINNSNNPLGCQTSAKGGTIVIGEGNRFFTTAGDYKSGLILIADGSQPMIQSGATHSYTIDGTTVTGLKLWTTPKPANTVAALEELLEDSSVYAITLGTDVSVPTWDMDLSGRTLDLNGHNLTVNSLIATEGNICDTTNSGAKLVVGTTGGKMNAAFYQHNTQLAVGDANGIWFTDMQAAYDTEKLSNDSTSYTFNFYIRNPYAKQYLINHSTEMKLGVNINGTSLYPNRGMVPGTDIVSYLLKNPTHGLTLTVKGLESYSNVSINMWVQINTTAKATAGTKLNPTT